MSHAKYQIQAYQASSRQFEDVQNGRFTSKREAIAVVREMESNLGFHDLRVILDTGPVFNLSGRREYGDHIHPVVYEGKGKGEKEQ